jgi:hypothetical protein
MLGESMESAVLDSDEAVLSRGLFWYIRLPESITQRYGSKSSKAIFYTFIAGDLLVSVSVTVADGDSEPDFIRFMEAAARSIEVKQEPFDVEEIRKQLREMPKPEGLANFAFQRTAQCSVANHRFPIGRQLRCRHRRAAAERAC